MHILMLVVIGLVVLAVFLFGARLLNRSEKSVQRRSSGFGSLHRSSMGRSV
jgi:hypothetical protein